MGDGVGVLKGNVSSLSNGSGPIVPLSKAIVLVKAQHPDVWEPFLHKVSRTVSRSIVGVDDLVIFGWHILIEQRTQTAF